MKASVEEAKPKANVGTACQCTMAALGNAGYFAGAIGRVSCWNELLGGPLEGNHQLDSLFSVPAYRTQQVL